MKKGFVLSVFLVSLIIVFAGFGSAALTLKNTTSSYFGASNDPAVFSSGSYMYIVYPGSLDIYDISNPVSPVLKSKTAAGANPTAVVVRGDYAYVQSWSGSWGEAMFRIWNVSNPSDPKVLGSFATNGMRLDVVGNYAYVSDHGGSIRIINITNPTNPTLAGSAAAISYIGDIKVVGNYAYVAVQTPGELQIFDVSNPASPQSVSHVATEGSNLGLDVVGNYAYVVNYISASKTNLIIFDVSNPASPQVVGRYIPAIDETYADIEVKDNIAYISTFGTTGKIKAFDVSNPASPLLLQTENTEVSGQNLYASGNYVYLVESNYQAGGSFFKIYDRGFTYGQYGDGRDNKLTVANQNTIVNKYARITSSSLSAGSTTIGVNSALGFAAGDEILIIQMQNGVGSSGQYEYRTISRVIGNNIVVPALTNSYYSGNFNTVNANAAQIVRIPHYTTLTVNSGASITAQAWDGYTGGIVAFRVSDTLTLNGVINVTGKGFRGGDLAGSNSGYQGESYKGKGIISPFNNSGGGGGGSNLGGAIDNHPGGGGGYGTEGGIGSSYLSRNGGTCTEKAGCMGLEINPAYTPDYLRGRGGLVYGDDSGSNVFLGSGGGASSNVNWGQATGCINGPGGNGAGAVIIYSSQISGNGKILSVGNKGEDGNGACTGWYGAGGGGGSGGAIMVVSSSNTPVNSLNISGGAPGASVTNGVINVDRGGLGGVGGLGRILSLVVGHPCDPDQTIMSIYSQNNTHAALWNDTDYNYKICYTDF
ncbi:MAG: beta-propeller domain-containing protein, partial [archaeon]